MYLWRKMSEKQREDAVNYRRSRHFPKHSPPHFDFEDERQYLISAACYEHLHIIGKSFDRMFDCEEEVLSACEKFSTEIYAWCILPNHYHVLLKTEQIKHRDSAPSARGERNRRASSRFAASTKITPTAFGKMSVKIYMDVHVKRAVTDGLRLRGVDVLTAQQDGAAEFEDPALLNRATELERLWNQYQG